MDQPAAGSLAPKGIGEIISSAFEVYKAHWQRLLTMAAVLVIPLYLIVGIVVALIVAGATTEASSIVVSDSGAISVSSTAIWALILASFIGFAIIAVAGYVVQGAITRGAATAIVGDPGIEEAFKWGMKRVGSFIWIAVLLGLLVGFAPLLVVLLLGLVLKGAGLALGFLIYIPAIIFLGTMFAVAIPALVVENRRGTDALQRSWDLVKGHFWHVLGAIVVGGIIAGVVNAIIAAVFGIFGDIGQVVGEALGAFVTIPFTALIAVIIYLDVRTRSEQLTVEQIKADLAKGN